MGTTLKIYVKILEKRLDVKTEVQLGHRKGKGVWGSIFILNN